MVILIHYRKTTTKEGDIIERRIWKVDLSKEFPYGIKYRLAYIHNNKRILGYDNERTKGNHKHYFNKEENYEFISVEELLKDFKDDIKKIRKVLYGNQEN